VLEKLFLAIGLVLALEGALYALFPTLLRTMLRQLEQVTDSQLRVGGLMALTLGLLLVWLIS
jgi:uncharacterized protein YjeT (DUF2065 family)